MELDRDHLLVPDSLYKTAVSKLATVYSSHGGHLTAEELPEHVMFDICSELYYKGMLSQLGLQFSKLEIFSRLLRIEDRRHLLHRCFQALMDHGVRISETLANAFSRQQNLSTFLDTICRDRLIYQGLALGRFLCDAGWFFDSGKVYKACLVLCEPDISSDGIGRALECSVRLFHVQNANCEYQDAEVTREAAFQLLEKLREHGINVNKAMLFSECCALLFAKSQFDEALKYCRHAMRELSTSLPQKDMVDVLCQCSKACVVKSEFHKAGLVIKQAVAFARKCFGTKHPKYSDALLDYGFYLLNVDSTSAAVQVYQNALGIRQSIFGGNNLHVAIAHENLAYASYVQEYSSGNFNDARANAEKAIQILGYILNEEHLLLSSSKRVKALILEEIAIASLDEELEDLCFDKAKELHLQALSLANRAFGENNVQTAKHYGNLGRLYQSMHLLEEAEDMHLKAIEIKERLFGSEDYEVALSVGHLASLYSYDMQKFAEAEKLYLRSIAIGKKLFGEGYSGLEYDYRGLLKLYRHVSNQEKADQYAAILQHWNQIRDRNNAIQVKPLEFVLEYSLEETIERHF
ncbi:hypothetical protein ACJMK2_011620 [Sinanodonta woodiana]|uniref:Amyloid protein-binding protein 2 n=1 Tax=Sinanodonta woodiana TaxID=1069815 RepID=A0ABD3V5L1_SINWO